MQKSLFYKKTFVLLSIALLVCMTFTVINIQATDVVIDSYSETNYDSNHLITILHPSSNQYTSAVVQSFSIASVNMLLKSASFLLKRTGYPGYLVARLYSHSGTYGSSSVPNTLLATSTSIYGSGLTESFAVIDFAFPAGQQYEMQASTKYVIVVVAYSGTFDLGNHVSVGQDSYSPTHSGNKAWYINSAWTSDNSYDIIFYVYGEAIATPIIGAFQSPSGYADINSYFRLNTTISNDNGVNYFVNATLTLNNTINLNWFNSTNTFTKTGDPSSYCTLGSGNSKTVVNSTSYKLGWNISFNLPSRWNITAIVFNSFNLSGTNSQSSTFAIDSPLAITFANTTAVRVDVSSTFYVNGTLFYNGTTSPPAAGLATIYVLSGGNIKGQTTAYNTTSGNFNFSVTAQSSVANWSYTVYAVNPVGPSVVNQTLYIVSDKIIITLNTDTTAPTSGSTAHMNATATYSFDGLNVTTLGVNIARNNTSYSNSTTWTDTEVSGTIYNFAVLAANSTTYGLTAFSSNTLTISWGNQTVIEVYSILQNSSRIGIGQTVNFGYRVRFGGNGSDVTSGTLTINGTTYTISDGWCNFTASYPNVELVTYVASGSSFNNTVFSQIPADPQVIFDNVNINLLFSSQSPQYGQNIVITWAVSRLYDNSTVTNYNMTISVNYVPTYTNITQSVPSITDSLAGTGSKTYSVNQCTDLDYNITSFTNIPQMVTWSQIPGNPFFVNPQTQAFTVTIIVMNGTIPVVGAQVVLSSQVGTTDYIGSASFNLTLGSYPITISAQGELLYSSSVTVSAPNQVITIDLATHPTPVIPPSLNPVSLGIIVITVIIVAAVVASQLEQKDKSKKWWKQQMNS